MHGYDLNEYGLLAAHSFLGLANRAYVLRADVDLGQLSASSSAPSGAIADGSYWLDTANSVYGLREYSGTAWVKKDVSVVDAININSSTGGPKRAFGLNGDFAVVANTSAGGTAANVKYYEKFSDDWYPIGSTSWNPATSSDQWASLQQYPALKSDGVSPISLSEIFIKQVHPTQGADYKVKLYSSPNKSIFQQ